MAHVVDPLSSLPERARRYQGERAGIASRVIANSIDVAVIVVMMVVVYFAVAAVAFLVRPRSFTFPAPPFGLVLLVGSVLMFCYFAVAWMTSGRTYGDHVLGLRVVGRKGAPLRPSGAIARSAICTIFPIGLFWTAVDPGNRCLQDVFLRTQCIYDWEEHYDV